MLIGRLYRVGQLASMEMSSGRRFELALLCVLSEVSAAKLWVNGDGNDGKNAKIRPFGISMSSGATLLSPPPRLVRNFPSSVWPSMSF